MSRTEFLESSTVRKYCKKTAPSQGQHEAVKLGVCRKWGNKVSTVENYTGERCGAWEKQNGGSNSAGCGPLLVPLGMGGLIPKKKRRVCGCESAMVHKSA